MKGYNNILNEIFIGNISKQKKEKYIRMPLIESDIIYLQSIFMTPGIHKITTYNIEEARKIVFSILDSLKWYQDIGFVGQYLPNSSLKVTNILNILPEIITVDSLISLFLNDFYYDFLIIESSKFIENQEWIKHFKDQLKNFKIETIIPIVVINFKC